MKLSHYLVGIDVGGTFTDILCYDAERHDVLLAKVPSVPGRQWEGVIGSLAALGIEATAVRAFVHGTTIATNTLLERKGARTGLVTTEGFKDIIEIGLTRRLVGGLFDIHFVREAPLVERHLRCEVAERMAADGTLLQDLQQADLAPIAARFKAEDVRAVAVCFINSYVNACNEQGAGARLRELLPGVFITESGSLIAERGEFGRFSTCVLNAYLAPTVIEYLETLRGALESRGIRAPVSIMTSNGGALTLERAAEAPVATFLSGPVGGVNGAIRICGASGVADCITFDMGGTSTDVALIAGLVARTSHANQIGSYPVVWSQFDIHTIGAGGGSIINVLPDGTIEVGPQSAGAIPGPACYLRGGSELTISDANLILGRLSSSRPISGGLLLSREAAGEAAARIATRLDSGVGIHDLADRALRLAVAKMAGAVREVSVHRGYDPREFALFGFGGAGPMHAMLVADELEIPRVLIPPMPGHLSAFGQMLADHRLDLVSVWGGRLRQLEFAELSAVTDRLRAQAARALTDDGFAGESQSFGFTLDLRYVGQSFTIPVSLNPDWVSWDMVDRSFRNRHAETFGYADPQGDLELISVRLVALGLVRKPTIVFAVGSGQETLLERRPVWFNGDWHDSAVMSRSALGAGFTVHGPAIIEESGSTTVVPPHWCVQVRENGTLDCHSMRKL